MVGKKLLVADDSLTIQKVIRLALSNEGYEIQTVSDGNEALQQISLFRPDVVLIDVSLPGKSAFEVKRATNELLDFRNLKFILMSSAFEKVDEELEQLVRFQGRLTKPFDPAHLRLVLSEVLSINEGEQPTQILPAPPPSSPPAPPPATGPLRFPDRPGSERNTSSISTPSMPSMAAPQAPPPVSAEPPMASGELWEEETPSVPPSFPSQAPPMMAPPAAPQARGFAPAPPPPSSALSEDFSDIRHLTESTIKMSGLDDFQWSVDDSAARASEDTTLTPFEEPEGASLAFSQPVRPEPPIPPPPGLADHGGSHFKLDPFKQGSYSQEPFAEAVEPAPEPSLQLHPPVRGSFDEQAAAAYHDAPSIELDQRPSPMPEPPARQPSFSSAQMEELVQRQVESALERLAQKILPEVAEKVIRQEIRKLLQEQG